MATRYELEPLTAEELSRWDELIKPFEIRELFHRQAWLDHLASSRSIEIRQWAIREHGHTAGYFCGGVVHKGPFRIFGSPLKGWCTNFMGPVANRDFDQPAFLRALDELAAREGFAIAEVESSFFSDAAMRESGYQPVLQHTYVVELTPEDPETMWRRIDDKSRQKVRKALRNGLVVDESENPTLPDEYYDQFVEVLARKNLSPPYDRSCPRLLYGCLRPLDLLFSLTVREPGGNVAATGLFPHDDRTVYFWGGASRLAARKNSPNDLLQWRLMEIAAGRGLRVYNMCGYGYFKSKFGGRLHSFKRWHKCHWRTAKWARRAYELYFTRKIRLRGWWQHHVQSQGA